MSHVNQHVEEGRCIILTDSTTSSLQVLDRTDYTQVAWRAINMSVLDPRTNSQGRRTICAVGTTAAAKVWEGLHLLRASCVLWLMDCVRRRQQPGSGEFREKRKKAKNRPRSSTPACIRTMRENNTAAQSSKAAA